MVRTTVALAVTLLAGATFADDVRIMRPIEAGILATEDLTLVAYFAEFPDEGYQVTATWLGVEDTEPNRLTMRLAEGDRVSFSLPGHAGTRFTFARGFEEITVEATPVSRDDRAARL
jgi:hypothetical protein